MQQQLNASTNQGYSHIYVEGEEYTNENYQLCIKNVPHCIPPIVNVSTLSFQQFHSQRVGNFASSHRMKVEISTDDSVAYLKTHSSVLNVDSNSCLHKVCIHFFQWRDWEREIKNGKQQDLGLEEWTLALFARPDSISTSHVQTQLQSQF